MPTQHNSPIYKDSHPKIDSASITILRDAGALIFGNQPLAHPPLLNNLTYTSQARHPLLNSAPRLRATRL